jgi:hypothetical protein
MVKLLRTLVFRLSNIPGAGEAFRSDQDSQDLKAPEIRGVAVASGNVRVACMGGVTHRSERQPRSGMEHRYRSDWDWIADYVRHHVDDEFS